MLNKNVDWPNVRRLAVTKSAIRRSDKFSVLSARRFGGGPDFKLGTLNGANGNHPANGIRKLLTLKSIDGDPNRDVQLGSR